MKKEVTLRREVDGSPNKISAVLLEDSSIGLWPKSCSQCSGAISSCI